MKNKPRYELRLGLAIWSGLLAIFSICGAIRVLPELIYVIYRHGLKYSICNNSNAFGVVGFWFEEKLEFSHHFINFRLGLGHFVFQNYPNWSIQFSLSCVNNRWSFFIGIITHLFWFIVGSVIKIIVQREGKFQLKRRNTNIFLFNLS